MALLSINGVDLPTPSNYQVGVMDITQSERNCNGTTILERIATKTKIQISYSFLTASQASTILTAISPVAYNLTYLDPVTNTTKTASFYNGDRSLGMIDFTNGVPQYKDLSFEFIER